MEEGSCRHTPKASCDDDEVFVNSGDADLRADIANFDGGAVLQSSEDLATTCMTSS
jgi:hypothetical protein